QRGIRARTEGGDSEQQLGEDQHRTADNAGELGDKIEATEVSPKESAAQSPAEAGDSPESGADSQPGGEPSESGSGKPDGGQDPSDSSGEGSQEQDAAEQG